MTEVIHGVVHGRTIQLAQDPGIDDGREVEVILRVRPSTAEEAKTKPESAAGMMAGYTHRDDEILAEIERERQCGIRPRTGRKIF
jgi:hypothetical protein